jgi:hypothetical protein
VDSGEAVPRFDLQIHTRRLRTAPGIPKLDVHAAADSTLPLSKEEKPPQEKAADKSWRVQPG